MRCLLAQVLITLLALVLCTSYVHAATAYVAILYSSASADTHIASLYSTGSAVPIQMSTNPVSYEAHPIPVTSSTVANSFISINSDPLGVALLGPVGAQLLYMIYSSISADSLVMFSPLEQTLNGNSYGGVYSAYNDKTYWLLPSDQAQAVGVMFLLSQRPLLPIHQILLAYTTNGVSTYSVEILPALAPVLGITGLAVKSSGGQTYSSGTYSSVFSSAPGIVYQLLESGENYPSQWIQQMVSDGNFIKANTTIGTTFTFDYMTLQAYNEKASAVSVLPPQNMLTASPVPGMESTEYQAAQDFVSQASSSIATVSTNSEKNFIMAGWVSGWGLVQALNMYMGTTLDTKLTFYNALSGAQSMFLVSDLFYGSMGKGCSSAAQSQGAICTCRWAGNNVWFHTFTKSGSSYDSTPIHGALFQYAQGTCGNINSAPTPLQFNMPQTIHVVGFSPTDNDMVSSMCSQTLSTVDAVSNTTLFWHHSSHAYRGYCLPATMNSASSDLSTHQSTYVTTSLMGVIPDAVVTASTPPSTLILDFMPQTTQPHISKANFVYLFPTLEQELYVLALYLSGVLSSISVVCGVVRESSFSEDITALLKKTLTTFGIEPSSANVIQTAGTLGSTIPTGCTHTFVVGASGGDAAGLVDYLGANAKSMVLLSFEDLTKEYESFVSSFSSGTSALTDRLVFATNLPPWTGATMPSGARSGTSALNTVEEFVQTLAPAAQTPAAARAFIVAMLYDQLTMGTHWGQPNIEAALYGNETVYIGGMTFGPFSQNWGTQVLFNYGAKDISVWSFTRVTDPSSAALSPPVNPSLVYLTNAGASAHEAVAAVEDASQESCIQLQASSSESDGTTTTTTKKPATENSDSTRRTSTTVHPSLSRSSQQTSSSADNRTLKVLLFVLVAILVALVVYIVLLLLLHFRVLQSAWSYLKALPCWRLCNVFSGQTPLKDANKVRATIDEQCGEDRKLDSSIRAMTPTSRSVASTVTVIFLEVEQWRRLWLHQPICMSRAERHFQRCLKHTAIQNAIYEIQSVEGMTILVCLSSEVGVRVSREVVTLAAGLRSDDADIVSREYMRLGCGQSPVKGLRLRVAVHTGTATAYVGPTGKVRFGGGAIEGAVRAAYLAGCAGQVVISGAARADCGLSEGDTQQLSTGNQAAHGEEALYILTVAPLVNEVAPPQAGHCVALMQVALDLISSSDEMGGGELRDWCMKQLDAHYDGIPEHDRISDLLCLAELFNLEVAYTDLQNDQQSIYKALLQSVSNHVATMMECRHGILRPVTRATAPLAHGGKQHSVISAISAQLGQPASGENAGFLQRRRGNRGRQPDMGARTYKHRSLRHFSYSKDE